MVRIGDHIINNDDNSNDDYESRRRNRRIPYNTLTTNRGDNSSNNKNYCPQCLRSGTVGVFVKLLYLKEQSAFICPSCSYLRYVNPTNRNEMLPGSFATNADEAGIPSLDGLTDQQALDRNNRKPIMRSINNPRSRSEFSTASRHLDSNLTQQPDKEFKDWAEKNNYQIVEYKEIMPKDNNTLSSREMREQNKE
jgi:hypothetical protein